MGEIEDPEKKKKKEEKAKEKELKKLKAAQKAEAAAAAKAAQAAQPSKKLEQKAKRSPASNVEEDSVNPFTPPGSKKILSTEMAKGYMPALVEASWYEWWEKSGFFTADPNSSRPPFVMVIPPPNVTGALHIGHALTCAIEDTIARWRRMSGYNVLWVPGVDHAGIATQVVVEKKLMKERKLTRHDVGREGFVAEVWKWKEQYGGTIFRQLRRLGSSLDWTRECFTMDDIRCKAVIEAFVQLHKENLIYRDNRLVNWDCTLRTAISDIEVEYIDLPGRTSVRVPGYETTVEFGAITSFAYPLEGDLGEIIVATTRPETMLGDTAIAVHPDDPRYLKLHGKFAIHPFNGRKLAIICDRELVDMSFGTGAVKITPAHDPNDYKVGKRHNLPFINIFTDDGNINSNGGTQFQGLKRFDARVAVVTALEEKGLYKGVADNPMRLGICSRSNDVIEPIIKPQWYVSCAGMAKAACDAVKNGELEIIPSQFEDVWFRWLEDIRDWCVSRQLWWGHRVPAWYVTLEDDDMKELGAYNDHWIVARNEDDANSAAAAQFPGKSYRITQDPDVLDTWFSSGLFPFSVMGWPEDTLDLKTFYPTFLLETGHDILFFWVARMVMLGMRLTGHTPFKQVYLHAMVRDAHGRKMSKSLGNVIDPLEIINGVTLEALHKRLEESNLDPRELEKAKAGQVADFPDGIEECGTDALRLGLIAYTMQSVNINLDIQRIVSYRQWCNKLWNAIKFAMMKLGDDFVPSDKVADSSLPFSCRWILSGLNLAIKTTNDSFEKYELSRAATAIYSWWYYELCDVFIEIIKPGLAGDNMTLERQIIKNTLWHCLETGLRLLHPIMPFVTEELWQRLPGRQDLGKGTIMLADYPKYREEWANEEVREQMSLVTSVVKVVRNLRDVYNVHPRQRPELFVGCRTDNSFSIIEDRASDIATLAALSVVKGLRQMDSIPHGCVVQIVDENVTAYLLLKGVVDFMLEISRMEKRKEQLMRDQETLLKKINIPGYTEKVPTKIQEDNQKKSEKITLELQNVNETIHNFQELLIQD